MRAFDFTVGKKTPTKDIPIEYIYSIVRGAFNKFPDFFVQAFKIVVDSWKFTMLLLYIIKKKKSLRAKKEVWWLDTISKFYFCWSV